MSTVSIFSSNYGQQNDFPKRKTIPFIEEILAISYLIVVVQSDGLEVLQFPQIPQFQRAILGT